MTILCFLVIGKAKTFWVVLSINLATWTCVYWICKKETAWQSEPCQFRYSSDIFGTFKNIFLEFKIFIGILWHLLAYFLYIFATIFSGREQSYDLSSLLQGWKSQFHEFNQIKENIVSAKFLSDSQIWISAYADYKYSYNYIV